MNLLDNTFHLESDCSSSLAGGGNVAITLQEMEGMFVSVGMLVVLAFMVVVLQVRSSRAGPCPCP